MNAPVLFESPEFAVRTIVEDDTVWFVATDVARALGYRMASDMCRRLDDDEKGYAIVRTPGGEQEMTIITESGLYHAVFGSQLDNAVAFRRWVTETVVPQIRKTGSYNATPAIPSSFAEALELAAAQAREIEALEAQAEIAAPKVEAFDMFMDANGSMSMNEAGKTLGVGQNELFKLLREAGVLIPSGPNRNLPYQRYAHHFEVVQSTYEHPRNGLQPTSTTRVHPSGLAFIARKLGLGHPSLEPATLALVSG